MDQELVNAAVYAPDRRAYALTIRQHFSAWMTSRPPSCHYDVTSEIELRQSMRINVNNNRAKFHPNPI